MESQKKLDANESKAWLQIGDIYRKFDSLPEALNAFLKAGSAGAPHAQISRLLA
jgi:hypothetical protein